jgi:spore maturation protein SpmA
MLNYIWLCLMLCALIIGVVNDLGYGSNTGGLKEAVDGAFKMAEVAVMNISLPLVGIMALWLGIMRLAEKSGMVQLLARFLKPVMIRLFPDVPADHPAMGSMIMNIAANMLGLSNAATPLGLRAMKDLDSLNRNPGTASNAMCTFLAINTSSIQLIPVTAIGILAAKGSTNPSSIIGTAFMATSIAAVCAVTAVKLLEKLPFYKIKNSGVDGAGMEAESTTQQATDSPVASPVLAPLKLGGMSLLFVYFVMVMTLLVAWMFFPTQCKSVPFDVVKDNIAVRLIKSISLLSIPGLLTFFPLYAFVRGIKVYEEFVEGAKEGFQVVIRIIPNLVAILVAIGFFRGAGGIDLLTKMLSPAMNFIHFPAELLPMALIRPLSGSGTLGVFTDIVNKYGADDILSKMAATIYGSTETTFYVLAIYFGSVGIKRTRHAVPAGLVADLVGIIASVMVCRMVFR